MELPKDVPFRDRIEDWQGRLIEAAGALAADPELKRRGQLKQRNAKARESIEKARTAAQGAIDSVALKLNATLDEAARDKRKE